MLVHNSKVVVLFKFDNKCVYNLKLYTTTINNNEYHVIGPMICLTMDAYPPTNQPNMTLPQLCFMFILFLLFIMKV